MNILLESVIKNVKPVKILQIIVFNVQMVLTDLMNYLVFVYPDSINIISMRKTVENALNSANNGKISLYISQ